MGTGSGGSRSWGSSNIAVEKARAVEASELPWLEDQEKALLVSAMTRAGENQSEAARLLRISRDTLRYRLKKHGIRSGGH